MWPFHSQTGAFLGQILLNSAATQIDHIGKKSSKPHQHLGFPGTTGKKNQQLAVFFLIFISADLPIIQTLTYET